MAYWYDEPSTSELRAPRAEDEQPVRHRRRRNTKQWCRGKVGVEHQMAIRLRRSRLVSRYSGPREGYWPQNGDSCGWSWWLWRLYDDWHYRCNHERYCTACGKIFDLETVACPDYPRHPKPTISAERVERDHWEKRTATRRAKTRR